MVSRLYSVYDRVAEEYGPVFEARNDAVAIRAYKDLFAKSLHGPLNEYDLTFMGFIFDHDTGDLVATDPRCTIAVQYEESHTPLRDKE